MHLQTIPLALGQNINIGTANIAQALQQNQANQSQFIQSQNLACPTSSHSQTIVFQQKPTDQSVMANRDSGLKQVSLTPSL